MYMVVPAAVCGCVCCVCNWIRNSFSLVRFLSYSGKVHKSCSLLVFTPLKTLNACSIPEKIIVYRCSTGLIITSLISD